MKIENYFDKYGVIYGVTTNSFGDSYVGGVFTDWDEANTWLHTEQYSFNVRELCSKHRAIDIIGKQAFDREMRDIANYEQSPHHPWDD